MHQIVFEDPYEFIPAHRGRLWPDFIQLWLPRYLDRAFGVVEVECRHAELLRASIEAGHGILLAPNHSRLADPMVLGILSRRVGRHLYAMASWHLFKKSRFQTFMIRRMGGFSLYREGADRAALNYAVDRLVDADRPVVVFPEGLTTGTNDIVWPLLEGPAFVARMAARRRAKSAEAGDDRATGPQPATGGVVVHPVAIRHYFLGDHQATLGPVVDQLERRLAEQSLAPAAGRCSMAPQQSAASPSANQAVRELAARVARIGSTYLERKEREYLRSPQQGDLHDRRDRLVERILEPIEAEWGGEPGGYVIARAKRLRQAILPDLVARKVTPQERARRWRQLDDIYLAQQFALYPRDYCEQMTPHRLIETVEHLADDVLGQPPPLRPWKTVIQVAPAIEVPADAGRRFDEQLSERLRHELQTMLDSLRPVEEAVPLSPAECEKSR